MADNENKHDHSLCRPYQKCIACEKLDRKFFDLRLRNVASPLPRYTCSSNDHPVVQSVRVQMSVSSPEQQ